MNRHRISTALVATITTVALATSGCSSSHKGSAPTGPVVSLKSLMFDPAPLTVKAGTTVTWRNDEPITHTVTSGSVTGIDATTGLRSGQTPDGTFNARLANEGSTFSYTFRTAGTYPYYCDIHQGMNAEVIVTP